MNTKNYLSKIEFKPNVKNLKVLTPSGYKDFDGISKIKNTEPTIKITANNKSVVVSQNHIFTIDGDDRLASNIRSGDLIEMVDGLFQIDTVEVCDTDEYVYELVNVEGDHVYYTDGFLSHNCRFLGSSNTLIEPDTLEQIDIQQPIDNKYGGAMLIYELPQPNAFYIVGVDSAKGNGADFSTVQVIKVNGEYDIEQVAQYRNNMIGPDEFAQLSIGISKYYNNAYMMVESNDIGELVTNKIWYDYECDRLLNCDSKGLGIRSTRKTKLAGNLLLKRYVENKWLKLKDRRTLYELTRYEEVSPNVFHAAGQNEHDDCVTSLIWALYFVTTQYYDKDSNEVSERGIDSKYKLEADDVPVFIAQEEPSEFRWEMY